MTARIASEFHYAGDSFLVWDRGGRSELFRLGCMHEGGESACPFNRLDLARGGVRLRRRPRLTERVLEAQARDQLDDIATGAPVVKLGELFDQEGAS